MTPEPKVIGEEAFAAPGADTGISTELYAYLATDDAGYTGVAYAETAAGHRIPLVAESERRAAAYRPIVERLAAITGRSMTLARFSHREDVEVIGG